MPSMPCLQKVARPDRLPALRSHPLLYSPDKLVAIAAASTFAVQAYLTCVTVSAASCEINAPFEDHKVITSTQGMF